MKECQYCGLELVGPGPKYAFVAVDRDVQTRIGARDYLQRRRVPECGPASHQAQSDRISARAGYLIHNNRRAKGSSR